MRALLSQVTKRAIRTMAGGLLAVQLAALFVDVPPVVTSARALPQSITCRITTYFRTAEMDETVGVRSTCPGGEKWGRTSPYKDIEVVTLDTGGPKPSGGSGPGGLPCEFLAKGCSNLPAKRF